MENGRRISGEGFCPVPMMFSNISSFAKSLNFVQYDICRRDPHEPQFLVDPAAANRAMPTIVRSVQSFAGRNVSTHSASDGVPPDDYAAAIRWGHSGKDCRWLLLRIRELEPRGDPGGKLAPR